MDDVAGDYPHQVGPDPAPGLGVEVRQVHAVPGVPKPGKGEGDGGIYPPNNLTVSPQ